MVKSISKIKFILKYWMVPNVKYLDIIKKGIKLKF